MRSDSALAAQPWSDKKPMAAGPATRSQVVRHGRLAPVEALRSGGHVMGQAGPPGWSADAAPCHECHQPTALLNTQWPSSASSSARPTRPMASGASPQSSARLTRSVSGRGSPRVGVGEPLFVERRAHPWPSRCAAARFRAPPHLPAGSQATGFEQHADDCLEPLRRSGS